MDTGPDLKNAGDADARGAEEIKQAEVPPAGTDKGLSFNDAKGVTLEQIMEMTGELGHLHELVMIHIEKNGGFTSAEAFFKTVQPILDLLEVEIRFRCQGDMTQEQVKGIIQRWIDQEIKECNQGL